MRGIIVSVALAIIMAGPACAESPASAPDSHLAAALDLLDATHSMSNVTLMLDALAPVQAQEIRRQRPDIDDATLASLQKAVRDEIVARQDEYKFIIANIYEKHFSESELKALTTFYRSDIGKKYVATMPALIQETAPAGIAWAKAVVADAVQKVLNKARSQGDHA